MDVELPSTGCNVMTGEDSFYNYSPDRRTRESYVISYGKIFKTSESFSQTGYNVSGTCLTAGDVVYRPELKVYFPLLSFGLIVFVLVFLYNITLKRFIK